MNHCLGCPAQERGLVACCHHLKAPLFMDPSEPSLSLLWHYNWGIHNPLRHSDFFWNSLWSMSTQICTITAPAWEVGCWAPLRYPSRSLLCLLSWHSSFLPSFLKESMSGNVGVLIGADGQRTCSFPPKVKVKVWVFQSSRIFAGLQPASLLCPWDSPGKTTGVGSQSCIQGIFPTQGSNPGLLHCRLILSL